MEGCCSFLVTCCKLTPGGLLLIPGGLLLIAGEPCYFPVVAVISDALLLTDGNIFLFQLSWKGTTDLCHLKMSPAVALYISSLIVHDHAALRTGPRAGQALGRGGHWDAYPCACT